MTMSGRDVVVVTASVVMGAALITGGIAFLFKSAMPTYGPPQVAAFQPGQTVRMKAFGHVGMVVDSYCPRGS